MRTLQITFLFIGSGFFSYAADITAPAIEGQISVMDIAADGDKLFLTYAIEEENKQIHLQVYEKNNWNEILLPANTSAAGFLDIQIYNSTPFILFTGYEGITLIKYEKGEWFHVGKPNFAADGYSPTGMNYIMKDGIPYILFENLTTKTVELFMMETEGNLQIWTSPDAAALIPKGVEQPQICTDLNQSVYTAWFDRKNEKVNVSRLIQEDEAFLDIGKGIVSKNVANLIAFTVIGNQLFLAYEDKSRGYAITIQSYNSSAAKWETLSSPATMIGTDFNLVKNKSIFLLNEAKNVVQFSFENNTWSQSKTIHSGICTNLRTCSDLDISYVAFLADGKLIIKQD